MRRRDFIMALGGSLVGTTVCLGASPSPAERPEIKIGDVSNFRDRNVSTGERRETRFRAIEVDTEKIVTETSGSTSGSRTFTRDWNLLEVRTGETGKLTYKPCWSHLQFPLAVGEKWDVPFEITMTTLKFKRNSKWQWKAQVLSVETVTVPAGTYQAFRIEYEGSFATRQHNQKASRSWTGTHKETAWYAPEVGRIVKREFRQSAPANSFFDHHVVELVSFVPAQG
jgi:hypothetical protein